MGVDRRMKMKRPTVCPICGGELEVDEEYMQSKYGAYEYVPWKSWTFYCDACENAGLWSEFLEIAKEYKVAISND
jgi:uncharacterized protein YbaR (Trm112 family)